VHWLPPLRQGLRGGEQPVPRGKEQDIEWIRVLKMEKGEFSKEKMNQGYPEGLGIQVGGNAYSPGRRCP
jgi:hypothetical protein